MSKIGLIIKREYSVKVKKKSFLIMTFLGPILFACLIFGAVLLTINDQHDYKVMIVDFNGVISEETADGRGLQSRFSDRFQYSDSSSVLYEFSKTDISDSTFKNSPYNVLIKIDDGALNHGKCDLYYKHKPSDMVEDKISGEIEEALERFRVQDSLQMDYAKYKSIKKNVSFNLHDIEKLTEEADNGMKGVVGFGFAILIYFFIFMYGVQVMRGVMEEKTNRIVEVIVSSVKPFQLMMGKVIGIGLVGLTQFVMWIMLCSVISLAASLYIGQQTGGAAVVDGMQQVDPMQQQAVMEALMNNDAVNWIFSINWPLMLGLFVFYFIGGYLLYGSLFAAIGAAVDNDTDSQQFMLPVTIPLIIGYIISSSLLANPESPVGTFFAIFPLTSPIVIMVKTAIGAPAWVILSSMVSLVLAFLGGIWLAGKIYRVGILMYGKKVNYKELLKWIRYRS
jgi:ABC-2 type transport system permease protein